MIDLSNDTIERLTFNCVKKETVTAVGEYKNK